MTVCIQMTLFILLFPVFHQQTKTTSDNNWSTVPTQQGGGHIPPLTNLKLVLDWFQSQFRAGSTLEPPKNWFTVESHCSCDIITFHSMQDLLCWT